jgi:peptidyl-prolyl cis-trans isomerase C
MKRHIAIAGVAAALVLASACDKKDPSDSQSKGPAVASVGSGQITVDQFKAKLAALPPMVQARYAPLERRKEFLDNMVRTEVLVAEARSRGLEKDPEVRATMDRVLAQRLTKLELDDFDKKNAPSEEELKNYYETHKSEFVRPDRIRVSHVFFGSKAAGGARDRLKAEAEKSLADVKSKEAGPKKSAFGALARSRSEDEATKSLEGDLGFHTREELAGLWGQPFADAAFSLKSTNDIAGVVATDRGFHLVKLTGRQPGFETSLDSAKSRIQSRLLMEKRRAFSEKLLADLKKKYNVTIHEDALKSVEVAANPAPPAGAPAASAAPAPSASAPSKP